MKKIFLSLFIIAMFSNALSQSYYLNVNLNDGNKTSFPIQDIKKITFSGISVDIKDSKHLQNLIKTFMLFQNYPNPFNPTTTIEYQVPKSGKVEINIFNISGQLVRKFTNEHQESGSYKTIWDGNNMQGNVVTSGIYIYKVKFDHSILSKRMIFIK